MKVIHIVHTVTDRGPSHAQHSHALNTLWLLERKRFIVTSKTPNIHTRRRTRDILQGNASRLHTLKAAFQQPALLGVQELGIRGIDVEKASVKILQVIGDAVAFLVPDCSRPPFLRVIEGFRVEAALGEGSTREFLAYQQVPEGYGFLHVSGEAAC